MSPGPAEQLTVTTVALDLPPGIPLSQLLPDADIVAWNHGEDGLVGWGVAWRGDFAAAHQFPAATRAWRQVCAQAEVTDSVRAFGTGLVAFGSFAFDPRSEAGGLLVVPRVVVGRRRGRAWLTTVNSAVSPESILRDAGRRAPAVEAEGEAARPVVGAGGGDDAHNTCTHDWRTHGAAHDAEAADSAPGLPASAETGGIAAGTLWMAEVEAALEQIADGVAQKVVLAREVRIIAEAPIHPAWVLRRLNSRFHTTWNYAVDGLVGATPEMLVVVKGGKVKSTVLAGTVPLPEHPSEAQIDALAQGLINSDKDLVEHAHAVDSVANALAPLCKNLQVNGPDILELPNVLHLVSDLKATYADKGNAATSLFLAGMLHPTAAVCGTPAEAALDMIREFEGFDRGRYSGPVGWINQDGDGEWGIALRCAHLEGPSARLYAGCGIVAGSDPAKELLESEAKLAPMRWALLGARPSAPTEDGADRPGEADDEHPGLRLVQP